MTKRFFYAQVRVIEPLKGSICNAMTNVLRQRLADIVSLRHRLLCLI